MDERLDTTAKSIPGAKRAYYFCTRYVAKISQTYGTRTNLVQWGAVFSGIAGATTSIVFAWWVLQTTGSVTQFGMILTVTTILHAGLLLFAGSLGDRLGPFRVLRASVGAQALFVLLLTLTVTLGDYSFALALLLSCLLAIANASVVAMINPVLAEFAPEGKLTLVMAQRGALASAAKLAGPALAATLLALFGGPGAMIGALAVCVVSWLMIQFIHWDGEPAAASSKTSLLAFSRRWMTDTFDGVVAFSRVRVDFRLCLVTCGINLGLPAYFAVLVPYQVITVYKLSPSYLGVFDVLFCAGMMIGGMRTVTWLNHVCGKVNAIVVSVTIVALMVATIGFSSHPVVLGASLFIGGCFMLAIFANVSTLRALATPKEYRARLMTASAFLTSMSMGPGIALCTWLLSVFGSQVAILAMAGIIFVSVIAIYFIPRAVEVLTLSEEEAKGAYLRLYPNAFPGVA
jgi:DHA3 family macrolide efflux protein-like MFS transporter